MYPQAPELPAVLGSEIAGELDGARVMGFVRAEAAGTRSASPSTGAGSSRCPSGELRRGRRVSRWRSSPPGSRSPSSCASRSARACSSPRPPARSARRPCRSSGRSTARRSRPSAARRSSSSRARSARSRRSRTRRSASSTRSTSCSTSSAATSSPSSLGLLKPMGTAIAVGYAGGMWQEVEPGLARRPQHRRPRLLPRAAHGPRPRARRARGEGRPPALGRWRRAADRRRRAPARGGRRGASPDRIPAIDRKGRAHSMTALVTGSAGGIGGAIVTKLRAEGFDVKELDLVNGFDVSDPEAWEHIGSVDLACLNAGVLTGRRRHRGAHRRAVPAGARRERRRRRLRRPPPRPRHAEGEHDHRHGVARRARRRSPTTRSTG